MSVAPCLYPWAQSGRVGSTNARHVGRLQPRHNRIHQNHRYPNNANCESKVSCEMSVNQARSTKSILADPKVAKALRAVSFRCCQIDLAAWVKEFWSYKHAGLGLGITLSEALFEKLTPQEQAELLSVAFIGVAAKKVFNHLLVSKCTQHTVEDTLSVAKLTAAFQQVSPE